MVDQCGEMNQCTGQDNKVGIGMKCRSRQVGINEASAEEAHKLNSVMIDSLGIQEVLPNHCQLIMVAERKGVDRLNLRISTPEGVPLPSYLNERGARDYTLKVETFNVLRKRSVKTDWQCRPALAS